jgi:hypothetical protein
VHGPAVADPARDVAKGQGTRKTRGASSGSIDRLGISAVVDRVGRTEGTCATARAIPLSAPGPAPHGEPVVYLTGTSVGGSGPAPESDSCDTVRLPETQATTDPTMTTPTLASMDQ